MRFVLKKPCANCPFRCDKPLLKGWLGETRAKEISDSIFVDEKVFACHKHLNGNVVDHVACAGSLALIRKTAPNHRNVHLAIRLGLYDPDILKNEADQLVFNNAEEFVNFHSID